ncbi:MAG TPA: primosomal protein, partial [Mycobacterium sp.]|nr:primosomal protein [Mycobacterium sp.]
MAADLVPIRLALTAGDRYTLWAPRWQDGGDEWEAFLGKDDDLYGFETAADLVAFVRTNTDNDLTDHPGWEKITQASAHRLNPAKGNRFDLVGIEGLLADRPTKKSVRALTDMLTVVASIGSVCELPDVTRFFNGNPNLGMLGGGLDPFTARRGGRKRWNLIAEAVGRNWDDVLAAIDAVIVTPAVDSAAAAQAADELAQEPPEELEEEAAAEEDEAAADPELDDDAAAAVQPALLGSDEDFWTHVGIDPIRIMTGSGTFYTLRCYLDDRPVFLGRNGRISVFGSERTLARYLADEHDHDLSDLSTYDDIRTA